MDEATRASMDGQIAAGTTFLQWIQRQPAWRQKQVFGEVRYRLMKEGGMHPAQFYSDKGEFITLDKLKEIDKQAFIAAELG